jgi:hypothetical protein
MYFGKINCLKLAVITVAFLLGVIGFLGLGSSLDKVAASASGPLPSHTNAPGETNCTQCHTQFPVNSGTGSVAITGLPTRYAPGQQIDLTVTVSQSDAVIYGFQLTAIDAFGRQAGSFTLPDGFPPKMQTVTGTVDGNLRTYVEHTIDGVSPTQPGSLSWTFTWNAPNKNIGAVRFYAAGNAANSDGGPNGDYIYTTSKFLSSRGAAEKFDFDGEDKADIGIFRPAVGEWWYRRSSDGQVFANQFGANGDVIVPADFTGDGKTDLAVWRPTTGQWFIQRSDDGSFYSFPFGSAGDIPCPGDFDGDGKADAAVFRPSTSTWFILRSSDGGVTFAQFGRAGDQPAIADYDGDGKADIGVFRPNGNSGGAEWWISRSSAGVLALQFGSPTDKAVVGDYTGDGKADVAVWRPSTGFWYILRSDDFSYYSFPFGVSGDQPAPADYDGDGMTDPSVFRASTRTWYTQQTTAGFFAVGFGITTDQAVPGAYVR